MDCIFILLICLIFSFFNTPSAEPFRPDDIKIPISKLPPCTFPQGQNFIPQQEPQPNTFISASGSERHTLLLGTRIFDGSDDDLLVPGETTHDSEANIASSSSSHTLANTIPNASISNLSLQGETADIVDARRDSTSLAHSLMIPNSSIGENIASESVILTMDISQTPSSLSSPYIEAPRNENFLTNHLIDQNEAHAFRRDEPFKLGESNLGLTFQATLALMLFHFEGSSSSSSLNNRSISFNLVGVCMVIGFTLSVIGIFLRNVCPRLATIGDYISLLSTTFGFFMMIEMFLPDSFSWTVWPACVFVLFAFLLALARIM